MYVPNTIPTDPAELPGYLQRELTAIAAQMANIDTILLTTLYAAPKRILEGMIVKADGTTWNPGSGAGVYCRRGAAWTFLG